MKHLTLVLSLAFLCTTLSGQDVSRQTELKHRIEEEISFIDTQLKSLSTKQKASTTQLTLIQKKIAGRRKMLDAVESEVVSLEKRVNAKSSEINQLKNETDTLEKYYNRLIYNTYKNRNAKVWFLYVLASENIGQGYRRFSYLKGLAAKINAQGREIESKRQELAKEQEELNAMLADAKRLKAEREREYTKLKNEETTSRKEIKTLAKTESQYKRELSQKRKQVEKLNREIERILNNTIEDLKKDNTTVDHALAAQFEANKGQLPWPLVQGVVTEHFGVNYHPLYKNLKMPQNNGVTFTTTLNANVYCVFDGIVKQIVIMPGYNQCILVQHGTYFTFYCRLSKVNVKSGQTVSTGECLGSLEADTRNSSQLHFQIWNGTKKQNPEDWIKID